jgi:16S rRNA processing protein RimM
MTDWKSMVTVGYVIRPHAIRGHVVVQPETDFADERFRAGARLYGRRDDAMRELVVVDSREHDGRWVVRFDGVGTVDGAEALRGYELGIPAGAVHELGPGAYYAYDLVGCLVRTVGGEAIGEVGRVDFNFNVPMLVVAGKGEVLVPFTDAICRRVDLAAREIAIDPPAGLIELNWRP